MTIANDIYDFSKNAVDAFLFAEESAINKEETEDGNGFVFSFNDGSKLKIHYDYFEAY